MPLPAAWHPLYDVGAPGRDGPRAAPGADAEVRGPLRGGQSAHRAAGHPVLRPLQCGHVRCLSSHAPAPSQPTRRLVVVLDNARYHHATLLRPYLTERRQVLSLSFLPPYSPELNPIERVWKLARKLCTHNQYFPVLADLVTAVSAQLELWRQPNPVLARLCGII